MFLVNNIPELRKRDACTLSVIQLNKQQSCIFMINDKLYSPRSSEHVIVDGVDLDSVHSHASGKNILITLLLHFLSVPVGFSITAKQTKRA